MANARTGTVLAAAGAVAYGLTILCNRTLAQRGYGPQATLSIRFATTAVVLFAILTVLRRPRRPTAGGAGRPLLLGAFGYAIQSSLFYAALQRGTAAAVALLFYVYPVIVTAIELATGRARATARMLAALGLSVAGTALIVATGDSVALSRTGVGFALGAAVSFALYLLASDRFASGTDPMVNGAWVAAGAATSLTLQGVVSGGLRNPGDDLPLMLANGAATAAAFSLLFAALARLGPSRTAMVLTLEALSAVILGALVLGEPVTAAQLVGGSAILGAVVLIAVSSVPAARWRPRRRPWSGDGAPPG